MGSRSKIVKPLLWAGAAVVLIGIGVLVWFLLRPGSELRASYLQADVTVEPQQQWSVPLEGRLWGAWSHEQSLLTMQILEGSDGEGELMQIRSLDPEDGSEHWLHELRAAYCSDGGVDTLTCVEIDGPTADAIQVLDLDSGEVLARIPSAAAAAAATVGDELLVIEVDDEAEQASIVRMSDSGEELRRSEPFEMTDGKDSVQGLDIRQGVGIIYTSTGGMVFDVETDEIDTSVTDGRFFDDDVIALQREGADGIPEWEVIGSSETLAWRGLLLSDDNPSSPIGLDTNGGAIDEDWVLTAWEGSQELWQVPVGSNNICRQDGIVVGRAPSGEEATVVMAWDEQTGEELWQTDLPGICRYTTNSGAFILSEEGRVHGMDIETGEELWAIDGEPRWADDQMMLIADDQELIRYDWGG